MTYCYVGHCVHRCCRVHRDREGGTATTARIGARGYRDRSAKREFERVREKVQYDFLPHAAVNINGLRQRWAIDDEPHPGPFDCGAEDAGELGGRGVSGDGRLLVYRR